MRPFQMGNADITIHHAQREFLVMLGYEESDLPMKLDKLYGPGTLRQTAFKIQNAIITRKSDLEYVVLYRSDGTPLACHVSLVSVSGDGPPPRPLPGHAVDPLYVKDERWAVLTVRSASAAGNAKFCGIGLVDTDHVLPEHLDQIGSSSSNPTL